MKNQQKNYNSSLVVVCGIAIIFAVYFGIKSQNLSNELSKKNTVVQIEEPIQEDNNISKIDSLLFKGEYTDALKMSSDLKRELNNFENDSMLLLRYNLVSEIVAVKSTKKQSVKKSSPAPTEVASNESETSEIVEPVTQTIDYSKQRLISELNPVKSANYNKASDYLTFNTTKGTSLHYIGSIKQNKANGYGVAILESGSRYEGQWKNNKREGKGKFFWNDGEYYEGAYNDDKREGLGTYTWKNGEKYVGEWKNDKRNGRGKFYNKKGKLKTTGVWENDELVSEDKKQHH